MYLYVFLGMNAKSRYFFELRPGFHSDLETYPDSRIYYRYCPAPKIDHFSESYPDSRTSSQHVSEWHHLRNHVSESTYEKIHARNPNIMRNTNPRSLGFKKHYQNSYIDKERYLRSLVPRVAHVKVVIHDPKSLQTSRKRMRFIRVA